MMIKEVTDLHKSIDKLSCSLKNMYKSAEDSEKSFKAFMLKLEAEYPTKPTMIMRIKCELKLFLSFIRKIFNK